MITLPEGGGANVLLAPSPDVVRYSDSSFKGFNTRPTAGLTDTLVVRGQRRTQCRILTGWLDLCFAGAEGRKTRSSAKDIYVRSAALEVLARMVVWAENNHTADEISGIRRRSRVRSIKSR